jgi:hypothetical protein
MFWHGSILGPLLTILLRVPNPIRKWREVRKCLQKSLLQAEVRHRTKHKSDLESVPAAAAYIQEWPIDLRVIQIKQVLHWRDIGVSPKSSLGPATFDW